MAAGRSKLPYLVLLGGLLLLGLAALSLPLWEGLFDDRSARQRGFAERGQAHFDRGDYRAAIIELTNALAVDGGDGRLHYTLGLAYLRSERPNAALLELQKSVRLDSSLVEAQVALGNLYYLGGDLDKAGALGRRLSAGLPRRADGPLLEARVALEEGAYNRAVERATHAASLAPDSLAPRLVLGAAHLGLTDTARAAEVLLQAAAADTAVEGRLALAEFYRRTGRPAVAEASLQQALARPDGRGRAFLGAAEYYRRAGQPEQAAEVLRRGVEALPDLASLPYALGETRAAVGDLPGAAVAYRRALATNADFAPAAKRLAGALLETGDAEEAAELIEAGRTDNPTDVDWLYLDGRCRLLRDDAVGAAETLHQAYLDAARFAAAWRPADLEYRLGQALMRLERFAEAGEILERVAPANPLFVRARGLQAQAALRLGHSEAALALAREVLAIDPQDSGAAWVVEYAAAADGDLERLAAALAQAVEADPDDAGACLLWGRVLRAMDARRPDSLFVAAARRHPADLPLQLTLAAHLQRAGDAPAAGRALEAAATLHDTAVAAHTALTAFYQSSGRASKAELAAAELLRRFPAAASAHLAAALVSMGAGREDEALGRLRRAVELTPEAVPPRILLAYLYLLLGDAAAGPLIESLDKEEPGSVAVDYLVGRLALDRGDYQRATLRLFRVPINFTLGPAWPDRPAGYYRAAALFGAERHAVAAAALDSLEDRSPETLLLAARVALAAGRDAEAVERARDLYRRLPAERGAAAVYAKALEATDRPEEAQRVYAAAVERFPAEAAFSYGLARTALQRGEKESARAVYEDLLRRDSGAVEALDGLLRLQAAEGQLAAAVDRCLQQVQKAPETAGLRRLCGEFLLAAGRDAEGAEQLRAAVRLDPALLAAHFLLGVYSEKSGAVAEARRHYERVLELDPQHAGAANNLAWIYAESGTNLEKAWQLAEMARTRFPQDPFVLDTLAWVYYAKGGYARAASLLEEGVELRPDAPVLHFHLGLARQANGEYAGARQALQRALELDPAFAQADSARKLLRLWQGG